MEVTHYLKYFLRLDQPVTQTTKKERDSIARHASGAVTAVEIGVFEGVNTVLIGQSMSKNGRLFGIDPFFKGRIGVSYQKLISRLNIARAGLAPKITLIEKFSKDAINDVPAELDFVFVDGGHEYEDLACDWELYSKKVSPNGIIALHDTSVPGFDPGRAGLGSIAYFNDVIVKDTRFEIIETVDSLNVLRRTR